MDNFVTAEEMALFLGVTPRHIQNMCRLGKIDGAVKRAGAWFIPREARIPIKNTKSEADVFKFVGTRKRIFDNAIRLFVLNGYEKVSIQDIADSVGIGQSAVYNHFKSKKEILDTVYDFYCHYFLENRLPMDEIEQLIRCASLRELINGIRYVFDEDYAEKLADISKIIFQRIAFDDRAREIFKTMTIDEGIKYVEDVFNRAVELGRISPCDTHLLSVFINSVRIFTFYNWIIDPSPESVNMLNHDEQRLYAIATGLLTDLKTR